MPSTTSRERRTVPAADHPTGHDLIAIDATPSGRPTGHWRCRACGTERPQPDEFETFCPGGPALTDGGASSEDRRDRDGSSELTVEWVTFGPGYRVLGADGSSVIVDVEAGTCRCDDPRETDGYCEHLRRADAAIRTGELPGPDGRYVR